MTDILSNIGLSRLFSSRIRHYLLFLELTNNSQLMCQITSFLEIRDVLDFLSSSTYLYSFRKITAIEVRLLKAKVDYYEKPKIKPTFQTFINFYQIRPPTTQTKIKSQKIARDHQCLKKFNKEIRLSRQPKKTLNNTPTITSQSNPPCQTKSTPEYSIQTQQFQKNIYSNIMMQSKQNKQKIQQIIKSSLTRTLKKDIKVQQKLAQENRYLKRFNELEYQVARKILEKRKKLVSVQPEDQHALTMQQLKKMAYENPYSLQTLKKIQMEEIKKMQKANVEKLKMKSIKVTPQSLQRMQKYLKQQAQKRALQKPTIAQKLIFAVKGLIRKQ